MMYFMCYNAYKMVLSNRGYPRRHTVGALLRWMDERYGAPMQLNEWDSRFLDRRIFTPASNAALDKEDR